MLLYGLQCGAGVTYATRHACMHHTVWCGVETGVCCWTMDGAAPTFDLSAVAREMNKENCIVGRALHQVTNRILHAFGHPACGYERDDQEEKAGGRPFKP